MQDPRASRQSEKQPQQPWRIYFSRANRLHHVLLHVRIKRSRKKGVAFMIDVQQKKKKDKNKQSIEKFVRSHLGF